jgi:hypothetical protein
MFVFFRDGGWGMYPTIIFGFLLVASGFLYLFRPESRYVSIVVCAGFLTIASGLLGTATGLITTFRYVVEHVPQPDQVKVAAEGCAESLNNIVLALILAVFTGLPTLGGLIRSVRQAA